MPRRDFLRVLAAAPAMAWLLAACKEEATESEVPTSLTDFAQPGTNVPNAQLDWAMAPFPDETIAVIGMNRGDFEDVGIQIGPSPTGAQHDCTESLAPLVTGNIDVCSASWESLGAQLDTVQNFRSFIVIGYFTGMAYMKPPESSAKTLQNFLDEGDEFPEAIEKTMSQLRGATVGLATDAGARLFYRMALDLAGMSEDDIERKDLSNPNIVTAALAGQIDFPAPSGGAEVVRLLNEGFEILVDQEDILENSDDPRRLQIAAHTTYITTDEFYAENYPTILRAASVIYNILDDLNENHEEVAPQYQLDFLNSYTGQETTEQELKAIHENISRLTTFEDAEKFFFGDSAFSVYTVGNAQLDALEEEGVLRQDHDASEWEGAKKVWEDLKTLKEESDALFVELGDGGDNGDVVAQAREHYERRNYLDSYRFLASIA